jgi:hypothetical protein
MMKCSMPQCHCLLRHLIATSGLYQVELKLQNTGKDVATGLFAKAESQSLLTQVKYISAPVDAVVEGNGQEAFAFVSQNGKAHKLPVRVSFIREGQVLLSSGLADGTGDHHRWISISH